MLGEQKQTFFTVKDLPAKDFIEAFANYLKKNNFIERPAWVDIVKTGTSMHFNIQDNNLPLPTRIGSTLELLPLPEKFISVPTQESDSSRTSTEVERKEIARPRLMITPQQRSSVGVFNNSKSRNGLRRIRKETALS